MACERFRDELTDVAAGQPAAAGTSAHLESCPSCRAELTALRRGLALADQVLGEIASAEPSPELPARIRRAAAEVDVAEPRPWRWAWVAVAAALFLAVGVAIRWRTGRVATPRQPIALASPSVSPMPVTPEGPSARPDVTTPGPAPTAGPRLATTEARRRPSAPPRRPAEPEVLVPPGQQEALLRFVALAHGQQVTPRTLQSTGVPSFDLAQPAPLEIKPLEIVPLDPAESPGT